MVTSPFQSQMFDDPLVPSKWCILLDIVEENEEMLKPKLKKKFFL